MKVVLTRHGATASNAEKRYCGAGSDEALSAEGANALLRMQASPFRGPVYTSGMLRTEQTAKILYPLAHILRVPDLREMEFGLFEGKNYLDLTDNEDYRSWVEGGCRGLCPGGEDRASFVERCCRAFLQVIDSEARKGSDEARFVVHGGTIMSIVSEFSLPQLEYFSVMTVPGGTWTAHWDGASLLHPRSSGEGTL